MGRKIILVILTVLVMAFIYSMSAAPADVSADMSGSITYRVAGFIVRNIGTLNDVENQELIDTIDHIIRKAAHFTEYFVLGVLLALDVRVVLERSSGRYFLMAWLFGVLYAVSDEWHQTFVSGRSGQVSDVCLDSCGVLVGVISIFLILNLLKKRQVDAKVIIGQVL